MPQIVHGLSSPWRSSLFLSLGTFVLAVGVLAGCAGTVQSSGTTGSNPPPSPLTFTVTTLPAATVQTSYTATVSVSGGTAPYRWSISSGALPAGLSLDVSIGQISGTPTQAGTASFMVQVSDSSATVQTASEALSITVSAGAVSITTSSLSNGTQGSAYSATLAASGGTAPYSWSITTGSLPAGLSLAAASGVISGTPTSAGTFNFTVQVTDARSQTATAAFTVTVNTPSTLSMSALGPKIPPAFQGMTYNSGSGQVLSGNGGGAVAVINGGTPPYTCSLTAGAVPTGMSLIETTPTVYPAGLCTLTGTPSVHGAFPLSLKVTDNALNAASLNVTFIVVDSNPPTISNVNAVTGSDPSKEVITWATNAPSDSQVIYGEYGNFDSASAVQDAGGVTNHAVTITVTPGVGYQYTVVSRGVVGGTPQDYELNTNGFQGASFTAGSAASGGTLAWYMRGSGPHNVVQGFPVYVGIYQGYLGDASFGSAGTAKWVVTSIPPFTQVHWPDIQDDGCGSACGTVSATTTTDDTFTAPTGGNNFENNTQFEILTNVGGTTPIGNYSVAVTFYGNGTPITSFNWPINVVSANFTPGTPSNPPLPAGTLATWASGMTTYGATWCNANSPQNPPPNEQGVWYYDGAWVFFQIGQYTATTSTWNACAAAVQSQYHSYVLNNLGPAALPGNEIFPDGFYYDAKVLSSGTSSQSATDLHNLAACPACGQFSAQSMIANSSAFFDGIFTREGCYMLGAKRLDYDAGGGTTLAQVKQMAAYCLGYVDQLVNHNGYEESFYDGLIAKALIDYYSDPNTGNGDTRVPPAMQALADHLWNNNWLPYYGNDGQFWYGAGTYGQFGPILMTSGTDNTLGSGLTNLNLLIAPLFAWVYHLTGQQQYQLEGDQIWADAVNSPPGNGIGWSGKNYSQQYRWSINYPLWRGATTGCYTLPACQ